MIKAEVAASADLVSRLAAKAEILARARGENRARGRRMDARRWRKAALLWPLFTKD